MLALLTTLGFHPSTAPNIYVSDTEYKIRVVVDAQEFAKSKIDYGQKIKVNHNVVCSFQKPENTVVLECVLRLLRKGYSPDKIELEKTWKLGHQSKGRLDIYVKGQEGKAYAMIECKTWGGEYTKERENTLDDGGQLFSYFVQDRDAQLLVLYSSDVDANIRYKAEAINTSSLKGMNGEQLFTSWDKSFVLGSLFDLSAVTYNSNRRVLKRKDLIALDKDTGKGLFNGFAQILRRHVVSDKSNAFNKIFNLFVCKIYDEDPQYPDDVLDFQVKNSDTAASLLTRLRVSKSISSRKRVHC